MKIFDTATLREWDQFTISQQYQSSAELMQFAAEACVVELEESEFSNSYTFFCGIGNNGGDGLCMAMDFATKEFPVFVYIVGDPEKGSDDFKLNMQRIIESETEVKFLSESAFDFDLTSDTCVVDCIFGTGIIKPVDGWIGELIEKINEKKKRLVSIDVPSGLMPDELGLQPAHIIRADRTITFEVPKKAMLFQENYRYVGELHILSISLDLDFEEAQESDLIFYEITEAQKDFKHRQKFAHKNQFGHARIIAGSKGKIGAALLSSAACIRSGAGLVTASIPACGYQILQLGAPEVMCETDEGQNELHSTQYDENYSATAIGPGIGEAPETALMLRKFLKDCNQPLVLDADALNIIAKKNLIDQIPKRSILTPHVGEFDRLFGKHPDSFMRFQTLREKSQELNLIIILKGAHSATSTPDGIVYFNSNGNSGMATAGTGDVLTGIICGLLAQGYDPEVAARLGVFAHGFAGDSAARKKSKTGMIAGDVVGHLHEVWHLLENLL